MEDSRTESVLASVQVDYEYIAEFRVSEVMSDPSTQVRREDNRAPKTEVARYAKLLKSGAEFPPIVIDLDGRVIDGNTRLASYALLKRPTIAVYQCDIRSPDVAKLIGVELNAVHGKRMEKAELVTWLSSNGEVPHEVVQRLTGWGPKMVTQVRTAAKFEARRDKLGITVVSPLAETVRAALMRISDAECFRALTTLADEAGLKAHEINVREINDLSLVNPGNALAKIAELKADRREQIDQRRAGLRVTTPRSQAIASLMSKVIIEAESGRLKDTTPATVAKSRGWLEDGLDAIKEVLDGYGEH